MFSAGLVIIVSLVCGTVLIVVDAPAWCISWPMGMSVFFSLLFTGMINNHVRTNKGSGKDNPWPKSED